jgi:hypothetical protein
MFDGIKINVNKLVDQLVNLAPSGTGAWARWRLKEEA